MLRTQKKRPFASALATATAVAAVAAPMSVAAAPAPSAAAPSANVPMAPGAANGYQAPDFPVTTIGPRRDPNKPDIAVIDAGGTLTSRARDRISYLHYQGSVEGGVLTILEDMYPELAQVANSRWCARWRARRVVRGHEQGAVRHLPHRRRAAQEAAGRRRSDHRGHRRSGGGRLFFDLTMQPVVVTGSMHQYGTFTYDVYTNLFSSIRLAASGKTTCFGTVVLLNDQFVAARDVTKTDGYRMDTFESRAYGALGVVDEDHIRTMRAPARVMHCGTGA